MKNFFWYIHTCTKNFRFELTHHSSQNKNGPLIRSPQSFFCLMLELTRENLKLVYASSSSTARSAFVSKTFLPLYTPDGEMRCGSANSPVVGSAITLFPYSLWC